MKRLVGLAVGFILVPGLLSLWWNPFAATLPAGSDLASYDRATWLDPESARYAGGEVTPRQKMLADVVSRLPGLDRDGIVALLGPPVETPFFKKSPGELIYPLGPERTAFFAIDWEFLRIGLNADGRFVEYEIVTD